ncbi:hypothetical protein [Glutamicibacter sp. Je.9.36]|uniref:hypothetical protein n=2 Tax=unclassified Glutamicibacter TaxID=2627139 RepID=UPI003DA8C4AD
MNYSNYAQWKQFHYLWDSLEHFRNTWNRIPGIHTIQFAAGQKNIDLYINENIKETTHKATPIFFSGAISNRTTQLGPFFSGLGMTKRLGLPLIAIADPALDADRDLKLAWYLGDATDNFGENLSATLDALHQILETELILVGGSGGGYAALNAGLDTSSRTTTLVWNPQTDIFEYSPRFVKDYLRSQYNFSHDTLRRDDWKEYCRIRTDRASRTSVVTESTLHRPRRLVYLQNLGDSHRIEHLQPLWFKTTTRELVQGKNLLGDDHGVYLAEFALGHAPPSGTLIGSVLRELMNTTLAVKDLTSLDEFI